MTVPRARKKKLSQTIARSELKESDKELVSRREHNDVIPFLADG